MERVEAVVESDVALSLTRTNLFGIACMCVCRTPQVVVAHALLLLLVLLLLLLLLLLILLLLFLSMLLLSILPLLPICQ
jgi:hypothetical protein